MSEGVVRVAHDAAAQRYEVYVGDRRAGLAGYRDEDGRRVLTHTQVDPEFGGRGLAGRLAKRALDDAREEGLRVVPRCSFMAKYVDQHPEYADLVK
jgi:predicted GNAT family acetyltransferase